MLMGASATSLGLSAGGLMVVGPAGGGFLSEALLLSLVLSAFLLICSAEAKLSG